MENIRYQVFVSSTYTDLKDERQRVTQTLMEMDCIPAGMELFPAVDEEQWAFIKKVIDDCDYYLLIVGGRYGSISPEGISYTEKEFDYAVEKGLKVVALLHENPTELPDGKTDTSPELVEKLSIFREKVETGRLVKYWKKTEDLPGMVALSLQKTIKSHPAVGWQRAAGPSAQKLLQEINELRKENSRLKSKVSDLTSSHNYKIDDIASLDETISASGNYYWNTTSKSTWTTSLTWREIFLMLSPYLEQHPNQEIVKAKLTEILFSKSGNSGRAPTLFDQDFQTLKIQFKALDLVTIKYMKTVGGGMAWFWYLTPMGEKLMVEGRIVRTNTSK